MYDVRCTNKLIGNHWYIYSIDTKSSKSLWNGIAWKMLAVHVRRQRHHNNEYLIII